MEQTGSVNHLPQATSSSNRLFHSSSEHSKAEDVKKHGIHVNRREKHYLANENNDISEAKEARKNGINCGSNNASQSGLFTEIWLRIQSKYGLL